MENDRLDRWMKDVLKNEGEKIPVPDQRESVLRAIKEEKNMRKFSVKKYAAVVAALCVMLTGSAIAGGKIVSLMGSGSPATEIKSYPQVEKLEKKAGFDAKTVKKFQNGFAFESANTVKTKGIDAKGNVVKSYLEVSIDYKKGKDSVNLYMYPAKMNVESDGQLHKTEYKGIELESSTDPYKFVPAGYEMTEEEKEKVEKGQLHVSEGADKVEEVEVFGVWWEEKGIRYLMMSKGDVPEDNLLEMAKDMIDNGR